MKFKVQLDITPEEEKVLAYASGYALFVLEYPGERQAGLTGLLREASRDILKTKMLELLSNLTAATSPAKQVGLDNDVAYCIASSLQAAREIFVEDFLDWRSSDPRDRSFLPSGVTSLDTVWRMCFSDMLDNPDRVVLDPWEEHWESVRFKVLRGFGAGDPQALREVLQMEYQMGMERRPLRDSRLRLRLEAIKDQRSNRLDVEFGQLTSCPTCASPLTEELFCRRCAEVFFSPEGLDRKSPEFREMLAIIGLDEIKLIHRASVGWAVLNDNYHSDDTCSCEKCYCGGVLGAAGIVCDTCGFVHATSSVAEKDSFAWLMLMLQGRRQKIVYNVASGRSQFKTFGARDLTDTDELLEAGRRRQAEVLENSEKIRAYIDQVGEISEIAGLTR